MGSSTASCSGNSRWRPGRTLTARTGASPPGRRLSTIEPAAGPGPRACRCPAGPPPVRRPVPTAPARRAGRHTRQQVPERSPAPIGQLHGRVEVRRGVPGAQGLGPGRRPRGSPSAWSDRPPATPGTPGSEGAGRWPAPRSGRSSLRPASRRAPAASATSGPAPGGSSSTAGSPLRPGPTSRTGAATSDRRRAVRWASDSPAPSSISAPLSWPSRRLAPPVSSNPAAPMDVILPRPVLKIPPKVPIRRKVRT